MRLPTRRTNTKVGNKPNLIFYNVHPKGITATAAAKDSTSMQSLPCSQDWLRWAPASLHFVQHEDFGRPVRLPGESLKLNNPVSLFAIRTALPDLLQNSFRRQQPTSKLRSKSPRGSAPAPECRRCPPSVWQYLVPVFGECIYKADPSCSRNSSSFGAKCDVSIV